jgi:hypothetical protein
LKEKASQTSFFEQRTRQASAISSFQYDTVHQQGRLKALEDCPSNLLIARNFCFGAPEAGAFTNFGEL